MGRFNQADTVTPGGTQGWDRYAAMANNPVNMVDPSGYTSQHCDLDGYCGDYGYNGAGNTSSGNSSSSGTGDSGTGDSGSGEETPSEPDLDNDVPDWSVTPDGITEEDWRKDRSQFVWDWLCKGGWWGLSCPNVKILITILLIREGIELMNDTSGPNAELGIQAMVGYMQYLFDGKNGIIVEDLSAITSFFNPKGRGSSDGAWTQEDRNIYQNGYKDGIDKFNWGLASDKVDLYWGKGPVYINGHMITRWWDNTEVPHTSLFSVNLPIEKVMVNGQLVDKVESFGY